MTKKELLTLSFFGHLFYSDFETIPSAQDDYSAFENAYLDLNEPFVSSMFERLNLVLVEAVQESKRDKVGEAVQAVKQSFLTCQFQCQNEPYSFWYGFGATDCNEKLELILANPSVAQLYVECEKAIDKLFFFEQSKQSKTKPRLRLR
ncbi:TPA: hypothetical protein ACPVZK_004106 [Vibrio parahaemolyticus]|jgi:hypothetical protein|uniref:hypothetical protein n=1 Tax=Vibrio harveyi group TaxID=717610 RepID=UPI001BD62D52|nr:hypothetical protein [Vibrio alginolyticus]MCF9492621.1 hypothetical protein [Vibrio parahaemolyticus]MBS9866689.1 hypothetical protein [Vibrio alginolyticus]MBS9889722.1 hypothetical protein [Vibrio alginolyticus]MCF9547954.1 hypothetical protein [Vibrio parahaemolyticus]MDG2677244.1 hypothetical protein [Vibrio parahaemolyticus]